MSEATVEKIPTEEIMTEETQTEETAVKPYEFRRLCSTDVFLMFKIISKIGVKEFNACFENDGIKHLVAGLMGEKLNEDDDASVSVTYISVILEIADVIFSNIPKCEGEIFQMLSNTSNLSMDEVKKLDFCVFTEMVIDFIKKEEFRDFIKVVSKLFK